MPDALAFIVPDVGSARRALLRPDAVKSPGSCLIIQQVASREARLRAYRPQPLGEHPLQICCRSGNCIRRVLSAGVAAVREIDREASRGHLQLMRTVALKVLKNQLSEYVRLAASGETVVITDRGRPAAELVPHNPDTWLTPLQERGLQEG